MNRNKHAREAQLRAISIFGKQPEQARVTDHGTAEVREGLGCIYEQDGRRIALDMPEAIGGSDTGPSPGYFGRAAICGCLAIGIKMTAARNGLHLDLVRVGIEQQFDIRGLFSMEDANAAPGQTRIAIEITSPEPEAQLRLMVDRALEADPWFLAFRDAQPVDTAVSVTEGIA